MSINNNDVGSNSYDVRKTNFLFHFNIIFIYTPLVWVALLTLARDILVVNSIYFYVLYLSHYHRAHNTHTHIYINIY